MLNLILFTKIQNYYTNITKNLVDDGLCDTIPIFLYGVHFK